MADCLTVDPLMTATGRGEIATLDGSADVDVRAAAAVRFGSAEDLSGHRGDLALAEDQVAEEVRDRTPFGPLEVEVRPPPVRSRTYRASAASAFGTESRRRSAPGASPWTSPWTPSSVSKSEASVTVTSTKITSCCEGMSWSLTSADLGLVLGGRRGVGLVGDQRISRRAESRMNSCGHRVQLHGGDPQFERPAQPGDQRDQQDAGDEAGGDLHAVRPLRRCSRRWCRRTRRR